MKIRSIQFRMLVAAALPVTVIAILMGGIFLFVSLGYNNDIDSRKARLLLHQVTADTAYGLSPLNVEQLQGIADGTLREPDVTSVVIVDAKGRVLARAGRPSFERPPIGDGQAFERRDPATGLRLVSQAVTSQKGLSSEGSGATATPQVLGHVLLELSQQPRLRRQRGLLLLGLLVTLGGILLGSLLSMRLARRVSQPLVRASDMIARIGQGELSVRMAVGPDDPLHVVLEGLNEMAARLESHRDELELRIGQATLALRVKKEEAEIATLAKSRFLAAASHDLRQPTHALGMFVARLAQLRHDDETRRLIDSLQAAVQAMQDLLDGLLDISRLDAGTVQVQVRAFALSDVFDQLRAELGLVAVEKGLRLRILPTRAAVQSDPALLHRILLNLLSNALRYTQHGGVLLACRPMADGQHVRVEVWDSGIGIAPEHHQAIFREFYQVDNPERDRGKGLGLGLAIVDRAAQLLGYPLKMKSRPGRGTRFTIEVPLAPADAPLSRRGAPRDNAGDNLTGRVVMVIEDDALVREALVSLLLSWGCIAVQADGLASALVQLEAGIVPDVIISDYRLRHDENGIDAIGRLRAVVGHPIPACLTSGDTDPRLLQAAKEAGLILLHKPVRPAKLRSLVRHLAGSRQAD